MPDDEQRAPLGYRDREYVENKLAGSTALASEVVTRLRNRDRVAEADFLMEALKNFQDAVRVVRRNI